MTCIILSGGSGSRIGGIDKAFLTIGRETFIERKLRQLCPLFEEIIIVVREPESYAGLPARIITDELPGQGPLMGLYSGLLGSRSDVNFVTTVDSPFTNTELAAWLVDEIGGHDAHVPRWGRYTEPLFAAYRKSCIDSIRQSLTKKRVISFYDKISVKFAGDEIIDRFDPEHRSFLNINSGDEYRRIIGEVYPSSFCVTD